MANQQQQSDAGGCIGIFLVALVIGLVVMAIISVAALVDPFSWLPPVAEIWADCEDDYDTNRDECALANRFPGFWGHVIANLGYTIASVACLIWLMVAVSDLRKARIERFAGAEQAKRYAEVRALVTVPATLALALALAALPIVVAIT